AVARNAVGEAGEQSQSHGRSHAQRGSHSALSKMVAVGGSGRRGGGDRGGGGERRRSCQRATADGSAIRRGGRAMKILSHAVVLSTLSGCGDPSALWGTAVRVWTNFGPNVQI